MTETNRIAILERALSYYADERVWTVHPDMSHTSSAPAVLDHGKRAREALDSK